MKVSNRRARFRALVEGGECIRPAPVCDPITARVAENLGYEVAMLPGSMASLAILGAPDLVLITLTELVEQTRRICRATNLSLLVDADHGYGNALNVVRTIEELENAGAAGATIEDTDLPSAFMSSSAQLTSLDEGIGKMRAAVQAKTDPDFLVVGRTSAASIAGHAEVVRRAEAYSRTGIDAIFFSGVASRETLDAIARVVKIPIFLGVCGPEVQDIGYLSSRGVRIWLHGHQPMIAAAQAAHECLLGLRDGTDIGAMAPIAHNELLRSLLRHDEFKASARDYLATP